MASSRSKNEELATVAGKMWDFMDKLASENPEEYKKFINQQLEEGKSIMTPPAPAFCIQCLVKAWETTCTLYINVCEWIRVPKPADEEAPVPVRGGTLRYLIDERTKLKTPSKDLVYDVAFNATVIEECTTDPMLEGALLALVLQFVEDQTDLRFTDKRATRKIKAQFKGPRADLQHSLDEHWAYLLTPESKLDVGPSLLKKLQNLKTEDPPDPSFPLPPLILRSDHSQQQPSTNGSTKSTTQTKKLIEVISSTKEPRSSSKKPGGSVKKATQLPSPAYSIEVREPNGKYPSRTIVVKVTLPGVASAHQVDLEVSENDLQLSVPRLYHLHLPLPASVNEDTTKAKFTSKTSILTITMPCL